MDRNWPTPWPLFCRIRASSPVELSQGSAGRMAVTRVSGGRFGANALMRNSFAVWPKHGWWLKSGGNTIIMIGPIGRWAIRLQPSLIGGRRGRNREPGTYSKSKLENAGHTTGRERSIGSCPDSEVGSMRGRLRRLKKLITRKTDHFKWPKNGDRSGQLTWPNIFSLGLGPLTTGSNNLSQ